ncbi:hypothetical protein ACFPTO_00085 [Paraburkholderia denitrificans]|uniref:Uncharacterized protein n=1 Tax=Paraburkholderia denitrificans TaxID=694025 RepID=A0ABW0J2H5_9BURK
METLKRVWAGQERLWKVWWLVGVPLWIVLEIIWILLLNRQKNGLFDVRSPGYWLPAIVGVALWILWLIAAWRSSPNVVNQMWKWVARVLIVLFVALSVIALLAAREEWQQRLAMATPSQGEITVSWREAQGNQHLPGQPEQSVQIRT